MATKIFLIVITLLYIAFIAYGGILASKDGEPQSPLSYLLRVTTIVITFCILGYVLFLLFY